MARFKLEVFLLKFMLRAMELLTILNHCHHHRGFVYQSARFSADKKAVEVNLRPRQGTAAVCSGCHKICKRSAYLIKEDFQQFWKYNSPTRAGMFLDF